MTFEIDFDYEAELAKAEKKRAQLEDEKDRVERELAGINHIIEGLQFLAQKLDGDAPTLEPDEPPADFEEMNFQEKIESVMGANRAPMTRIEIRNALQAQGVTGTTPKHLLISVHTTLARMKEKKQVKTVMTTRGTGYRLPNSLDKFHGKVEEAEKEIAAKKAAQLAGVNPAHILGGTERKKK